MTTEQYVTIFVGLGAALIAGGLSFLGVRHSQRAKDRLAAESRRIEAEHLIRKYRDPLVRAAFDLQSRLYNIVTHDFLGTYYVHGTEAERHYARENTLYVIGEFFGWVEILRREIQFLDLNDIARNRALATQLDLISQTFLSFRDDPTLRVFRGEQRAIGESMTSTLGSGGRECIGFAAFTTKRDDPAFSRWFAKLGDDVDRMATEPGQHIERARDIQWVLIDLIDFLDPDHQYFPDNRRQKLPAAAASHGTLTGAVPAGEVAAVPGQAEVAQAD